MPIVISGNASNQANIKQISTVNISHLKKEKIAFSFSNILLKQSSAVMPFLSGVSDKKIEDGEGVILREREKEIEGGWV